MLSMSEGDADIQRAMRAGAAAYLLKSMPNDQVLSVIRSVHAGRKAPWRLGLDDLAGVEDLTTAGYVLPRGSRRPPAFAVLIAGRSYDDRMPEPPLLSVGVECYAGHRGEQTPRTLILGDRRLVVAEVVDAWLAPDHRYFKLKCADGHTYLVRHDARSGTWELTMFRAEHVG